jgi:sugar O-acyltransferase (sialic acid O-acetyltransferase NeuD family)
MRKIGMTKQPVVIIGAGRFGAETLELGRQIERATGEVEIIGFLDDKSKEEEVLGCPVLGGMDAAKQLTEDVPEVQAVVAIGDTRSKQEVVNRYKSLGLSFANLIHPQAIVPESVRIGRGCIITAGCILTIDIDIGNHVILNLSTTVGHDAVIGEFSTLNPQIAVNGRNVIGEGVYIGTGAKLIHEVKIGDWSVIGAGAVVVNDIPENVLAVGVPAKPIKVSPYSVDAK